MGCAPIIAHGKTIHGSAPVVCKSVVTREGLLNTRVWGAWAGIGAVLNFFFGEPGFAQFFSLGINHKFVFSSIFHSLHQIASILCLMSHQPLMRIWLGM